MRLIFIARRLHQAGHSHELTINPTFEAQTIFLRFAFCGAYITSAGLVCGELRENSVVAPQNMIGDAQQCLRTLKHLRVLTHCGRSQTWFQQLKQIPGIMQGVAAIGT
jgi:hypothetical protein